MVTNSILFSLTLVVCVKFPAHVNDSLIGPKLKDQLLPLATDVTVFRIVHTHHGVVTVSTASGTSQPKGT